MNNTPFNGSAFNGSGLTGNNITLTGGVSFTSLVSSTVLTIGIVLSGGMFTASDAQGAISQRLQGGVDSDVTVGAKWFLSTGLAGGIRSTCEVDSVHMGFEPSLRGGIHSPVSVGGQHLIEARLQSHDQVGQSSVFNSPIMGIGRVLTDGIKATGYLGGGIRGSTVLVSDGVKSNSKVDSPDIKTGRALTGGVSSTYSVGGKTKWPAFLRGGILGVWELGKEIDISAKLQGAIHDTHSVGGGLLISPVGNGGLESSEHFTSNQLLSPAANGGIASSAFLQSGYKIIAKLQQGLHSDTVVGGKGITASQILRGGVSSLTNSLASGQLKASAYLQGPINSTEMMGGDIVQGFLDPLLNTWALEIRSATVLLEIIHPTEDI